MDLAEPGSSLTILAGGNRRALPAAAVLEILRPLTLTPVPLAPADLLGVANLRGDILPVVTLAAVLGHGDAPQGPATRIVVVRWGAAALGVRVDAVLGLGAGVDAEPIDLEALLAPRFAAAPVGAAAAPPPRGLSAPGATGPAATEDLRALVGLQMAGQDYALDLDAVTEITAVPPRWTTLPGGGAAALGVVEHRGRLLPLLSLRGLLGLPPAGVQAAARIVVIQRGGQEAGLVVDMVTQVLRVPQSAFDPVPPVLTRGAAGAQVDAICRLDGGRRLVAHLDTARLLDAAMLAGLHDATAPASPGAGVMPAGADRAEPAGLDGERFVAVRVGGAEYGLPIAAVDEVVRHPGRLTQVPHAPGFVEGVMNLRGAILPVINQHQRFGAGRPAPPGPNRRIVVTHFGTTQAGFAVDSASALRVIPRAAIRPAPAVTAGRSAVFDRMATDLDGGVMLLIDPRILLSDTERDLLAACAA